MGPNQLHGPIEPKCPHILEDLTHKMEPPKKEVSWVLGSYNPTYKGYKSLHFITIVGDQFGGTDMPYFSGSFLSVTETFFFEIPG